MQRLKEKHGLEKYCWSLELCEDTYQVARTLSRSPQAYTGHPPKQPSWHWYSGRVLDTDRVLAKALRVHAHATLKFKHQPNIELQELEFMGAKPCASRQGQKRTKDAGSVIRDGMQAFFYLQIKKTSTILQEGNVRPFEDYLVNSDWAMKL